MINTKPRKVFGIILILLPFAGAIFAILGYAAVGFVAISVGMSAGSILILNYVLALLGILAFASLSICVPLGIAHLLPDNKVTENYDKRSGTNIDPEIPKEIKGWNWGVAGLNIIWAFYHRLWFSVFMLFVPIVGLIWWIVMCIKGNEWAWKRNKWESVDQFNKVQKKWKPWGIFFFIIFVVLPLISVFVG